MLRGSVEWTPWRSAGLLAIVLLLAAHAALHWIAGRSSVLIVISLGGAGLFFAAWTRLLRNRGAAQPPSQ